MKNKIILERRKNFISFGDLEDQAEIVVDNESENVIEFNRIRDNEQVIITVNQKSCLKITLNDDCRLQIVLVVNAPTNLNLICHNRVNLSLFNLIYCQVSLQNRFSVDFIGENSFFSMQTLDYINTQNCHQNNIIINHLKQNNESLMKNNLVAQNRGKIILDGITKIHQGSKKSYAEQDNRGVILDDCSTIKAIPCLLIDEFDCNAHHGAAIGKISDEGLFYLMSRGLNKKDALNLIISGFIKPFTDNIKNEILKNQLQDFFSI